MPKLKLCPFCGSKVNVEHVSDSDGRMANDDYYRIRCESCTATISSWSERKVVEAWNRRVICEQDRI